MSHGTSTPAGIESAGLAKKFGVIQALRGIDLRVESGESVALFGPNGAGKTTLIRILTLSLRASGGSFTIEGLDPRRDDLDIRARIGVISHHSLLYDDLTARQNLEFYARLYGVPDPRDRADTLLREIDLVSRADDAVGTFSRGMQQRVSLARSLVHDPGTVFLDEPFTGLDPHAAQMLRNILARLRRGGRTVFLVTHNLAQGLELCDRWLILSRGRIVEQGLSRGMEVAEFERLYFDRLQSSGRRAAAS